MTDGKTNVTVSVIMPVFNEAAFIEQTMRSLQAQEAAEFKLEILLVDGMSQDSTREKIAVLASEDSRIRLLSNPSRHTPAALNIGLRAAAGEYVCILGAHAIYDSDYISVCLEELLANAAVGCSGQVVTTAANSSLPARLVAWAAGHPFASSSRSVRTQREGFADTVPFPVMRKQPLLDLGGYNENLVRNQDNDMNQRLRAAGYKLYATSKTLCRYYARPTIWSFLRYAFLNGLWNAFSLRENAASMGLRHLAPMIFVSSLLALLGIQGALVLAGSDSAWPLSILGLILAAHLSFGALAGLETAWQQRTVGALWLAPLILAFHVAYGLGTLRGVFFSFKPMLTPSVEASGSSNDPV